MHRKMISQVSDLWHKLVYDSYRVMYPMVRSEQEWKLTVLYKDIASNDVRPEKKCLLSMFRVGSKERIKFFGVNVMSPFYFDRFALTVASVHTTDSIQIGIRVE